MTKQAMSDKTVAELMAPRRGRPRNPPPDVKAANNRRRVLERGLLACYEIIDGIRMEMAELDRLYARRQDQWVT